jgi:hypothetical protein
MIHKVSDARSNTNDQIAHAATVLGKSKDRIAVFKAIYFGKKKVKTVQEISDKTRRLSRKRVLEEGKKLAVAQVIHQTKFNGDTAYEKDDFYAGVKGRILSLAGNRRKLDSFPTKTNPRGRGGGTSVIKIRVPRRRINAELITLDDIDSFSKVRRKKDNLADIKGISEAKFKNGVKRILNETGRFQDWGGERNDLLTTRLRINGKRLSTAFAFKGPGKRGTLTPAGMGKNGDQIQRLFTSPAQVFIVQYWHQIADSVLEQMETFAAMKSVTGESRIYYGIIDGDDSARIVSAYGWAFKGR